MLDVTETAVPPLDIWPYIEAIPEADMEGYELLGEIVEHVWRSANKHFEHVLVSTKYANVFLVIIVDLFDVQVYGHHLLNMPKEYGIV
ncbi:MAG: hypothetical protein ACRYG7_54180 [Janthinobacterium lividum]